MVLAYYFGKMEQSMKVNSEMTSLMEKVEKSMRMENFILENLRMIKLMDLECFKILMEENMKVTGKKTNSMEEERRYGIMDKKNMMVIS